MRRWISVFLAMALLLSVLTAGAWAASEEPAEGPVPPAAEEAVSPEESAPAEEPVPEEEPAPAEEPVPAGEVIPGEEEPALDGGFVIEDGVLISYSGSTGGVTVPDNVTEIGPGAFQDCTSIYGLEIPGSVVKVGDNAFSGCTSVKSVSIAEGVRILGNNSFSGCRALETLRLPASLTEVGDGAFSGCGSLKSVSFAGAVDQWEAVTIGGNNEILTGLTVSFGAGPTAGSGFDTALPIVLDEEVTADVKQYNKTDGKRHEYYKFVPEAEERYLISGAGDRNSTTGATGFPYPGCRVYDENREEISGSSAGGNANESRETYTLEAGRTYYLEVYADRGDTVKLQITTAHEYDHNICVWCGDRRLLTGEKNGLTWTILGDELTISGDGIVDESFLNAIVGKSEVRSAVLAEGVTAIGDLFVRGFGDFTDLERVTLPESLTQISAYAFSGCSKLPEITIPAGVTSIAYGAFQACSGLKEITLPAGITKIDWRTFFGCTSLSSVELPEGLTKIDGSAFSGCSSLKTLEVPAAVTEIGEDAFSDTGLETFAWPENCGEIGKNTFSGCAALASITIPAGVGSIGEDAFAGCGSLGEVSFGGSLGQWWQLSDEHAALAAAEVSCADPSEEYLNGAEGDGVTWTLDIHGKLVITGEGETDSYSKRRFEPGTWEPGMPLLVWSPFQEHRDRISTVYLDKGVTGVGTNLFYNCEITDVYYSGTQAQWDAMTITEGNEPLTNARLHVNSPMPGDLGPVVWDVNGDGTADRIDWRVLARALATGQDIPGTDKADLDGDGVVDRLDRIALARTLAG